MAKVSCNYINKIDSINIEDLKKPIVFVVDMINGFVKEGSLSDIGIMDIVPSIQKLLNVVKPSIFICDSHDLNAREFNSFPLHCVKNTEESKVIAELKSYASRIMYKNSTNAFVSAEVNEFIKNELDAYKDIVIVGCCTDICVMQFALSLNTYFNENEMHDKRVIVPINMVETYDIENVHEAMKWNENACDFMRMNAIDVIELK